MCNKRQHDSENITLRHENRRLKAELEETQEKLHARNTAKDWPSWRITFQSSEQAGQAAFSMLKQARDENEKLNAMIDQGIA